MYIQGGEQGTLGIVRMRDRRTENRHHRIANMFINGAAIVADHLIDDREKAVQQRRSNALSSCMNATSRM